jgi:hypothetical protein
MERDLELEAVRGQVERLEARVRDLDVRWESEITADLRGQVAALRGTVAAQQKLLRELHELVLRRLIP